MNKIEIKWNECWQIDSKESTTAMKKEKFPNTNQTKTATTPEWNDDSFVCPCYSSLSLLLLYQTITIQLFSGKKYIYIFSRKIVILDSFNQCMIGWKIL